MNTSRNTCCLQNYTTTTQNRNNANRQLCHLQLRTVYYFMMSTVLHDPKAQALGMVELNYEMRWTLYKDDHSRHIFNELHTLRSLIPVRTAAMHAITNDAAIKLLAETVRHVFPPRFLSRIRIHTGTFDTGRSTNLK
jgi:hypothetical protein